MSDRIKGSALTMGGAVCWGVSGCMGQYLFTREGMDSTWLVPIRLFLAGLILCGFFFIKDRKTLFDPWNVRKNPRNAIDLLVYGLAGVSCCQFTYFLTIQLSSAGMGTILQDVSPVIILLVVCIQQKRGPRVFEVCSILLALVGVFLITTHGSLTGLAVSPAALVSGIVSACCVAIYTMWPKKLQEQYPTPMLQGWAFLMGGIMFALIFRPWQIDYVPTAMGAFGIFIGRGAGQCAGVQSVHVGRAAHRPAEGEPLQLCRTRHGGHHQHAGAGLALYAVGCAGLRLYFFDAGAAEPARKTEKLNILRNTPAQV